MVITSASQAENASSILAIRSKFFYYYVYKVKKNKFMKKHYMRLADAPFILMKKGSKHIEIRLFDCKRQLIEVGDHIVFKHLETEEKLLRRVVKLIKADTFLDLAASIDVVGSGSRNTDPQIFSQAMHKYYSHKDEVLNGVLAIYLERI